MTTFFTLLDKAYDTREQAVEAETKLIEAGYSLAGEYIQQWWLDDCGNVVSEQPKDWRGHHALAEQRNRLIDWVP